MELRGNDGPGEPRAGPTPVMWSSGKEEGRGRLSAKNLRRILAGIEEGDGLGL